MNRFFIIVSAFILIVGLVQVKTGGAQDTPDSPEAEHSCMVNRMLKAGIPLVRAHTYERRALLIPLSESKLATTHSDIVAYLLQATIGEVDSFQDCVNQKSETCKDYSPCENEGECQLSLSKTSYLCKCQPGYTGDSCQHDTPAPLDDFKTLQDEVSVLLGRMQQQENKTKYVGTGCSTRSLGYKYQSKHNIPTDQDSGVIATISFRKKYAHTVLKLSYSSNVRTWGADTAVRWYFKIDNEECSRPTPIDIGMYQGDDGNTHIPAILTGICEAAGSDATIPQGDHTITVNVGMFEHHPRDGNSFSRWVTTSILEVQEMCPQF